MSYTEFCQAMVAFASTFPQTKDRAHLQPQSLTDGLIFCQMLVDSKVIDISEDELDRKCVKWISKVSNLKKILMKIRPFYDKKMLRTDKIQDIDVVEIAKNSSQEHLVKFFQVVMTVLLLSPSKQHYIEVIMGLEASVQKAFVEIIKNSNPEEDSLRPQNSTIIELQQEIKELRRQNADMKSELNELTRKNKYLQRELKDLRDKLISYQQELQLKKTNDHSVASDDYQSQIQKQKLLIDNLKLKVLTTVRESQIEISHLKEQISSLKLKAQNMEEVESTLEQYKELYNQALTQLQKMNGLEKQHRKLLKIIQDKDTFIRKLQNRLQAQRQNNNQSSANKVNQNDKKAIRSEKDVKRLKSEPSQIACKYSDFEFVEDQKDEIRYLQEELNRARLRIKQFEKENIKHRKKFEKFGELQKQKKRLQRVVTEINRSKDAEIEFLVTSLYELRDENIRMFEIIRTSGLPHVRQKK